MIRKFWTSSELSKDLRKSSLRKIFRILCKIRLKLLSTVMVNKTNQMKRNRLRRRNIQGLRESRLIQVRMGTSATNMIHLWLRSTPPRKISHVKHRQRLKKNKIPACQKSSSKPSSKRSSCLKTKAEMRLRKLLNRRKLLRSMWRIRWSRGRLRNPFWTGSMKATFRLWITSSMRVMLLVWRRPRSTWCQTTLTNSSWSTIPSKTQALPP